MEELFVLCKKFGNKRIVRNIYEYTYHTRHIWLRRYRYVIKNGTTLGISELWDFSMGVHTFILNAERYGAIAANLSCVGLSANPAFGCSHFDWIKRSKYSENRNLIEFMRYATRVDCHLSNYINLLRKINYPKYYRFFDDYELYACCQHNNIYIENDEDREYMIHQLLKL